MIKDDLATPPSGRLDSPLCHLGKEHWEVGGDAGSCTGAGTRGEQVAGLNCWPLAGSLYLRPLQRPGRGGGEEGL